MPNTVRTLIPYDNSGSYSGIWMEKKKEGKYWNIWLFSTQNKGILKCYGILYDGICICGVHDSCSHFI